MPALPAIPDATEISVNLFAHLLSLYPVVLQSVYESKIKDAKKLQSAFDDDEWRYRHLPRELKERRGKAEQDSKSMYALRKEELQRLVQWKITHGTYRPFLPALIRKNDPDTVESISNAAFTAQEAESYKDKGIDKLPLKLGEAITTISKLQGVGPATAPLLCSIFDPENVPFFEDELYEWLFPGSEKLKYSLKEYLALFHATRELRQRLGVSAVKVEQVGFVVGHLDVLDDGKKEELEKLIVQEPKDAVSNGTGSGSKPHVQEPTVPTLTNTVRSKASARKRTAEAVGLDPDTKPARRSKRTRQ